MEAQKLTKKQRKSLAFRTGKRKKPSDEDVQEIPEAEILDDEPAEADEPVVEQSKATKAEAGKKRKRGEEEVVEKPKKKKKAADGAAGGGEAKADGEQPATKTKAKETKKRYILFVGNLPKTITESQIASHFSSLPSPPSIRLRRPAPPKPGQPPPPPTGKERSKLFAFLEFSDPASLQGALKLHRSNLGGKMINVELTVGGGGSGEGRKEKLAQKRKQAAERLGEYAREGRGEAKAENRKWKQEHKGESRPKRDMPRRSQASGVNAIPVG